MWHFCGLGCAAVPCRAPQLIRDQSSRMLALTPDSLIALFARDRARSDDPETDDGPDTTRPPAGPPIHPFTGTFADSEHTIAYRSKVFRMMMPLHIVAIALLICDHLFLIVSARTTVSTGDAVSEPPIRTPACLVLSLGARIAVHRWEDQAKAQHLGAMAWTITIVSFATTDAFALTQACASSCAIVRMYYRASAVPTYPLSIALFALVNTTHGMEFWHTTLLVGVMFCDFALWRIACGDLLAINLAMPLLVVVHAFCHFNTLLNRHAFLETGYLRTSRERLEYDFQRLELGLHRLEAKLPVVRKQAGGSASTESSESTSTAPGRAPRSTQSAPAAMAGRGRPVPEDGHRDQDPPVFMRCAGAVQPHARSSANGHASEAPSTAELVRRCRWSPETLNRADTASSSSSAPSAFTLARQVRRKMRRLRRRIEAEERARVVIAIRRCPYI